MVAYDAFTHTLTNSLFSEYLYNQKTFSKVGLLVTEGTNILEDIMKRNVKENGKVVESSKTPITLPGSYGLPIIGVIYDTLDFCNLNHKLAKKEA